MVLKFEFLILLLFFKAFSCDVSFDSTKDVHFLNMSIAMVKGEFLCHVEPLSLDVGSQFSVYLDPGDNYIYSYGRCYNALHNESMAKLRLWRESSGKGYSIREPVKADTVGRSDYECIFYTEQCTSFENSLCYYSNKVTGNVHMTNGVKCSTTINVTEKGKHFEHPKGYLTANQKNFISGAQENVYMYSDGEGTNFTCHKDAGSRVKLTYTTRAGKTTSTEFQPTDSVRMYVKLGTANHEHYVTCSIVDDETHLQQEIQLTMKLARNKNTQNNLTFKVNGQALRQVQQNGTEYYYEYKYFDGEQITLGTDKDDEVYGDLTCSATSRHGMSPGLENYFKGGAANLDIVTFTLRAIQSESTVQCSVRKPRTSEEEYISIMFLYRIPDYSPYITGLPISNVLLQYSNATNNIIKYSIAKDEILHLDCFPYPTEGKTIFYYNHNHVITPKDYTKLPRPFQLRPNQENALITCREAAPKNKVTYLTLIRRKESAVETTPKLINNINPTVVSATQAPISYIPESPSSSTTTTTLQPEATKNERQDRGLYKNTAKRPTNTVRTPINKNTGGTKPVITKKESPRGKPPQSSANVEDQTKRKLERNSSTTPAVVGNTDFVWIIIPGVVLIIVIAVFVFCIALKKRKQILKQSTSNMEYQSLPEHHEGQMPTPAQWNGPEDVTYAEPNLVEHLYSKPVPKDKRNELEPTYAEPRDSVKGHTYLNVQQIKNDDTYAAVYSDKATHGSEQNTDPTYALVQNTGNAPDQAVATYVNQNTLEYQNLQNLNIDHKYAEIVKKTPNDPEKGPDEYQNEGIESNDLFYADLCTDLNDTHKYVNGNVKNTIEPTYSEIVKDIIEPTYSEIAKDVIKK